jgi:farnesyl diphosphate synthase
VPILLIGTIFMTFSQKLEASADQIERRLRQLIADATGRRASTGEAIEDRLIEAITYASGSGGKRLRPFLLIETARVFGIEPRQALDAACALEFVHCYSLVHDDLPSMDNDELRRGQPTVWKAFDEWTAILVGDALLTLAFEVLSQPQTHPEAEVRITLVGELARASGVAGMVGGQALDLAAGVYNLPAGPSPDYVRLLQAQKTGALIEAACLMGGCLGKADDADQHALSAYGKAVGRAFQIADDLLDLEGEPDVLGKAAGKDDAAGKATLVTTLGPEAARSELNQVLEAAIASLDRFGDKAKALEDAALYVGKRNR